MKVWGGFVVREVVLELFSWVVARAEHAEAQGFL